MNIMEYFRKKAIKQDEKTEGNTVTHKKEKFVADISVFELENVDWFKFGTLLKRNKILPPSYVREPVSVDISIDKKNRAKAVLEFASATSDSTRKFLLLQDGVFQYVNGAIDDGKNEDLINIWGDFQEEIRYRNRLETNREGYFHKQDGEKLMKKAEKLIAMDDIYDREQQFLEEYKDAMFDNFYYRGLYLADGTLLDYGERVPQFRPLIETEDGKSTFGQPVVPFSPRTLEFCILHMTNGQKIEDGEYPEDFEKKCKVIQEFSCYESEDWDKVIEFGKEIVTEKYKESEIAEALGLEME